MAPRLQTPLTPHMPHTRHRTKTKIPGPSSGLGLACNFLDNFVLFPLSHPTTHFQRNTHRRTSQGLYNPLHQLQSQPWPLQQPRTDRPMASMAMQKNIHPTTPAASHSRRLEITCPMSRTSRYRCCARTRGFEGHKLRRE